MATRRKYAPPKYRDGGRVPVTDMAIPGDEPRIEPAPVADDNALQNAIDADMRAEELQRDTLSPLEQHLASLPITEHQRAFLRAHPEMITDEFRSMAMAAHYREALAEGIEDDTPEMDQRILDGVQREVAHQHKLAMDNIRRRMAPEPAPEPAPAPIAAPPPAPAAAAPPARRSMPVSAPVSRDIPMTSGNNFRSDNTLTAEERQIARTSFTDPNMTNGQKEYLYLQNKKKLAALRASGQYPQPERN